MKAIYVELTSKLRDKLDKGEDIPLPNGISLARKKGSKACFFECEDDQLEGLIGMVESLGLVWQDNT